MNTIDKGKNLARSPDPGFLAYYAEQSAPLVMRARFARVWRSALKSAAAQGADVKKLRILGIGCAAGAQARLRAESGCEIFGLDVNAPLIEMGRLCAREVSNPSQLRSQDAH